MAKPIEEISLTEDQVGVAFGKINTTMSDLSGRNRYSVSNFTNFVAELKSYPVGSFVIVEADKECYLITKNGELLLSKNIS